MRFWHKDFSGLGPMGRSLLLAPVVACFTIFYIILIFTKPALAPVGSWQFKIAVTKPDEDDDPFALHPERHIFRPPRTIRLEWNITRELRRPDGVLKHVYLINGQFPGPTIEARSGDRLEVVVSNRIANYTGKGIAIHWHGLTMKGFNEMDGVVGVTQCPTGSGQKFVYIFNSQQHGTFWYHAHSATERADGLYGGMIVHKPASEEMDTSLYQYDSEKLLLVGDWYHRSADIVLAQYKDFRNFANEPVPDSFLINGLGSYNCSNARPGRPVDCLETGAPSIGVTGTTRLRIINTGASAGYSFQLTQASMQLITVDGGGIVSESTPSASALGVLYPGERMDVLLRSEPRQGKEVSNAVMKISLDPELMQLMNPALTRMQTFPITWIHSTTDKQRKNNSEILNVFNMKNARGRLSAEPFHTMATETAVLYTSLSINSLRNDEPWGELNHTSWVWKNPNAKPMLTLSRDFWANGTEQANPLRTFRVPWFKVGSERWLDLVINNVDDKGHPFHLHGYEFYVMASRRREFGRPYNPFVDGAATLDTKTPLKKDTVYIQARGYVILRIRLDNPGLWLMHCHVLWHQAVGMGTVLQIGNISEATAQRAERSCQL